MLRYYLIIDKATGFVIPLPAGKKGGSHVEPADPAKVQPRLFLKKAHAKGWLTTWLKGKVTRKEYTDRWGDYDYDLVTVPVPSRKRENFEIVSANISWEA